MAIGTGVTAIGLPDIAACGVLRRSAGSAFHVTSMGPEDGRPVIALHGYATITGCTCDLLGDLPDGLKITPLKDLPARCWLVGEMARTGGAGEDVAADVLAPDGRARGGSGAVGHATGVALPAIDELAAPAV